MKTALYAVFILSGVVNAFALAHYGDLCPIVCIYRNSIGMQWATTEIIGEHTIWKNEKTKQEQARGL